jgi:hypothetical protein
MTGTSWVFCFVKPDDAETFSNRFEGGALANCFALMVADNNVGDNALITRMVITCAERQQLLRTLQLSFGSKLDQSNPNCTVGAAWLIREGLTNPNRSEIGQDRRTVHQIRHRAKSRRLHDHRPPHLESDRLRPIPQTDRFELFYWSNAKGRWTTFGNMGRMKLMLKSAHVKTIRPSRASDPREPSQNRPKSAQGGFRINSQQYWQSLRCWPRSPSLSASHTSRTTIRFARGEFQFCSTHHRVGMSGRRHRLAHEE